jgi:hypothetical protein
MRNRRIALENEPICHWCHKAPSTEADHLIEVDSGGTDDLENLVAHAKNAMQPAEIVTSTPKEPPYNNTQEPNT